jgi:hypothetical protein
VQKKGNRKLFFFCGHSERKMTVASWFGRDVLQSVTTCDENPEEFRNSYSSDRRIFNRRRAPEMWE